MGSGPRDHHRSRADAAANPRFVFTLDSPFCFAPCLIHFVAQALSALTIASIHGRRRPIVERLMDALLAVELEVLGQPPLGLPAVAVVVRVNLLVLHAAPQPLDEHVVERPATSIHADRGAARLRGRRVVRG